MHEHSARVLSYAYNRGASRSEAEDVVAEVFLVCWRRLDDVPAEALPWLLGVARKVLANQRRSRSRRDALQERIEQDDASFNSGFSAPHAASDATTDILVVLAQLSEADRDALLLVAWDGLSYKEAAQALDCTRAAFGLRLHRARRRLLKQIGESRTHEEIETKIGKRKAP